MSYWDALWEWPSLIFQPIIVILLLGAVVFIAVGFVVSNTCELIYDWEALSKRSVVGNVAEILGLVVVAYLSITLIFWIISTRDLLDWSPL